MRFEAYPLYTRELHLIDAPPSAEIPVALGLGYVLWRSVLVDFGFRDSEFVGPCVDLPILKHIEAKNRFDQHSP
jgi:hypothetical protein